MEGCSSKSPVRIPAPSLYCLSFGHWGLSAVWALAALDASRTTATIAGARPVLVIGRGEGTPAVKQCYDESNGIQREFPGPLPGGYFTGETLIGGGGTMV